MAYASRMPDRNRALAVITVAGLHGIALYALVTGLGVDYIKDVATVLQGRNVPLEPVPPPPPPPTQQPVDQASRPSTRPASPPMDAVPNPLGTSGPIEVPLPPIDPFILDPIPGPTVAPTPEKPLFAPKSARPRNDPGSWVSTDDYPATALRRGDQGTVRFELAIGADGRVADCRVTASSGSAELDAATCRHVLKRARFDAPTDGAGARTMGTYAGSIRWVIPQD